MSVATSSGTKLYVAAEKPATYDKAGFDAITWTEVGEVVDLGEIGPEFELVTYDALGNRVTQKLKGQVNMGSQAAELGKDVADAGQTILKASVTLSSLTVDSVHSFKVEFKDTTYDCYTGLPMSYTTNIGAANNVTGATTAIEVNDEILNLTV